METLFMVAKAMHGRTGKPERVTKRALQAVKTRNRIYESVTHLMKTSGFDSITIEQISEAAEVSVGAFYHHFGSKNEILNEIFKRGDDYFCKNIMSRLAGETTAEKIVSFFRHYARFNIDWGVDYVSALFKTQSRTFVSSNRLMFTTLQDLISEGVESGEITSRMPPEEITELLFTTARGLTYNWCLNDGGFPLEAKMRRYMEFHVNALLANDH